MLLDPGVGSIDPDAHCEAVRAGTDSRTKRPGWLVCEMHQFTMFSPIRNISGDPRLQAWRQPRGEELAHGETPMLPRGHGVCLAVAVLGYVLPVDGKPGAAGWYLAYKQSYRSQHQRLEVGLLGEY